MSRTRNLMCAVGFPLVLGACGDPVEPGGELTEEEAVALLRGTMSAIWGGSAIYISEDSVVLGCREGGRVTGVGQADDEFNGDTTRLVIDLRFNPSGCKVTEDGKQFTVDGNPSFRYEFFIEHIGSTGETDVTGGFSDGVKWRLGDRSGSCAMDLTLVDPELAGETVTGSYEGKLCGLAVEVEAKGLVPPEDL